MEGEGGRLQVFLKHLSLTGVAEGFVKLKGIVLAWSCVRSASETSLDFNTLRC